MWIQVNSYILEDGSNESTDHCYYNINTHHVYAQIFFLDAGQHPSSLGFGLDHPGPQLR